ncbi:MAG: TM0106 family RecB-like putative nuclease [Dongiaceae bacterium]
MLTRVATVRDLAAADPHTFLAGNKTTFPGIGQSSLEKFHRRAGLLSTQGSRPYLRAPVALPDFETELFFDIEVDPMRDVCYLHGFVERRSGRNGEERFVYFIAEAPTADEEKRAFAGAISFIRASQPCGIYYYSKYERTWYRKLRAKYPDIATEAEIDKIFDPSTAFDLYYDVVLKATEWPTRDFSIKTLAKHLGFAWRDIHPSGAASIEWYHRWVETGDAMIRRRILEYNEDDCRATRVLLDGIRALPLR